MLILTVSRLRYFASGITSTDRTQPSAPETITPGSVVQPTDSLYEVSDLSRVWVMAQVPEERLAELSPGMAAEVRVRAYPDRVFPARVTRIGTELDPATPTVQVRCETANPRIALKTGMYAAVRLLSGTKREATVVPAGAVQRTAEASFVFVPLGEGSFERRTIRTGDSANGVVEVLEGLEPGTAIVVEGGFLLKAELASRETAAE